MAAQLVALRWAQTRVAILAPVHRYAAAAYDRALSDLIRFRELLQEAR